MVWKYYNVEEKSFEEYTNNGFNAINVTNNCIIYTIFNIYIYIIFSFYKTVCKTYICRDIVLTCPVLDYLTTEYIIYSSKDLEEN